MNFCFCCGTGPLEKVCLEGIPYCWKCSICQTEFSIILHKEAQLTLEEAEAKFNAIPLTDKKALRAQKRKKVNS